jgi:hypothetical protein
MKLASQPIVTRLQKAALWSMGAILATAGMAAEKVYAEEKESKR